MIVHRSSEATPYARGEAFGRAQAAAVANTVAVYRRMFGVADARSLGAQVRLQDDEQAELAGIAAGAGADELELRAVNARTEILAGLAREECSVVGTGNVLAQNWDWHPDCAGSTLVWVVEQPDGRWFATLTEAGLLAKIGLNDTGLGVCLNLLGSSADGGLDGTPIHVLLRRVLAGCRTVDEALALLVEARVTASSAVTVATPGDVAAVELSPGGANLVRGAVAHHTNHFLFAPRAGTDTMVGDSPSTLPRLDVIRREPLDAALRNHEGLPKAVCRHLDPADPWAEQTVTVASVVMDLAARRLRVTLGQPCTHAYEDVALPVPAAA